MKLGAGYPMGPFELLDYTGLDLHKVHALPNPSCKISLAGQALRIHFNVVTSVGDPWHFGADPDPRIRTSDFWIRIQLRIRLLSSPILRCKKKYFVSYFFSELAHRHIIFSLKN
jgi:hypothetical protein